MREKINTELQRGLVLIVVCIGIYRVSGENTGGSSEDFCRHSSIEMYELDTEISHELHQHLLLILLVESASNQ